MTWKGWPWEQAGGQGGPAEVGFELISEISWAPGGACRSPIQSSLCPQISEKLSQLQARRQETSDKWQEKVNWLQLGESWWTPSLKMAP